MTHNQEHSATLHEITLEAFLNNPLGSVDVESGQDLYHCLVSIRRKKCDYTYIVKQEDLRRRIHGTSERDTSLQHN